MENKEIATSTTSRFWALGDVERVYLTIDRCKDDWFNLVCIMRGEWKSSDHGEIGLMEDALQFIHHHKGELNGFRDAIFIVWPHRKENNRYLEALEPLNQLVKEWENIHTALIEFKKCEDINSAAALYDKKYSCRRVDEFGFARGMREWWIEAWSSTRSALKTLLQDLLVTEEKPSDVK